MAPPVSYGGFWQHPGLGQTQDVKPFSQNPFLPDKTPTSLGITLMYYPSQDRGIIRTSNTPI